jgi:hypothetical protein
MKFNCSSSKASEVILFVLPIRSINNQSILFLDLIRSEVAIITLSLECDFKAPDTPLEKVKVLEK